jgi:outer membrane protein
MIPRTLKRLLLLMLLLTVAGRGEEPARPIQSLTIQECIARALANNLDIAVERMNPTIANWGVVGEQGVYDPRLKLGVTYENDLTKTTVSNTTTTVRIEQLGFNTGIAGLNDGLNSVLGGKLPSGALYDIRAFDSRTISTPTIDAQHAGSVGFSGAQPLLKNAGFSVNSAQIRIARKARQIAQQNFESKVMDVVRDVNTAYYELIFAIENHKSLIEDLTRAKELLAQNRRRVEIGTLSPLDVTQAEAGVAEREEAVIVAAQAIHDSENVLKRLICRDVSEFRSVELLPVDYPVMHIIDTDVDRSTRTALESRPDFIAAKQDLERQGILVKYNRNQLLPRVDVGGSYQLAGGVAPGPFSDALNDIGSGNNPSWSVGALFTIPLGNRQARSTYNISRLNQDQLVINLKILEQNILVQVDNAVRQVQTNLKRVEATAVASRLARESLKAEETKLAAGTSTSFLVLQAQSQLAAVLSAEIRARSDYSESLANLARVEGTILLQNNIVLDKSQ